MAVSAGTAALQVVPTLTKTFSRDLATQLAGPVVKTADKAGKESGRKFGVGFSGGIRTGVGPVRGIMRGFGPQLATAFGATALVSGIKAVTDEAREAAIVGKQTAAVLKSTGGAANISAKGIEQLAQSLSNKVGVDDEAIQSSQNLLLTFTGIRNEAGKGNDIFNQSSAAILDMTAAMNKGNITSEGLKASTIQVGKALNDPIKGMTALSRVGVTFTDQQKQQIKTLVESGDKLGAQKIILAELNKEFGGSATASADAGKRFGVFIGNLKEQIGTVLLPILNRLLEFLVDKLPGAFAAIGAVVGKVAGFYKDHRGAVLALVGVMGALVAITKLHAAVMAVQTAGGIVAMIKSTRIVTAVTKTWAAVQWLMNAALTANPIGLVIAAIAALVVGLVIAYKKSETFRTIVDGAFRGVADAVKFMWEKVLRPTFSFLVRTWLTVAGTIVKGAAIALGWVPGVGPKLKDAAKAFDKFAGQVNTALGNIDDEGVDVKLKSTFTPPKGFSMHSIVGAQRGMLIPGYGGGDRIPIMAEKGEAVVPKHDARDPGFQAWAASKGIPGFQRGGLVFKTSLFSPRGMERTQEAIDAEVARRTAAGIRRNYRLLLSAGKPAVTAFIKSTDPLPYVWGAAGPGAYDCSGLVSAVYGKHTGRGGGHGQRYFTTSTISASGGLKRGLGGVLEIGVTPGRGHMAGRYGGKNGLGFEAESSRTGIKIGAAASRPESFARHFHMARGGRIDQRLVDLLARTGADIGGDPGKLRINGKTFDRGGTLAPGLNLLDNRTGRPEPLVPAGGIDYDRLAKAVAQALRDEPPVTRVADVQAAAIRKDRRLGGRG